MSRLAAIGLDIGTTSTSVVAVGDNAKVLASASRTHGAAVPSIDSNEAIQSPEIHRSVALELIRQVVDQVPATPVALGLTGQMHGLLLVDANRSPKTPLVTWQDRRCVSRQQSTDYLESVLNICSDTALNASGCRPSAGYGGVTLGWLQHNDLLPAGVTGVSTISDWLCSELTDSPLRIDRTHAAAWGIFDLENNDWSLELIEAFGLDESWLPELVPTGSTIGIITPEVAQQTHLAAGLPVCVSVGDNQSAVLGSLPPGPDAMHVNIGTGGQVSWKCDEFRRLNGVDLRPFVDGAFLQVGAGFAGGDAYASLIRIVQSWASDLGVERSPDEIYTLLEELATQLPIDADGLRFRPTFRGTRQAPHRLAEVTQLSETNFSLGHIARAAIGGIAEGLFAFVQNADPGQLDSIASLAGGGNGLRRNSLLREAVRERFNRPIEMTAFAEEAAAGAALLAGSQHGLWKNLTQARAAVERVVVE